MSYDRDLFVDREDELDYLRRLLKHERSKVVMRIQADEWMGKTWLVGRMGSHCRETDGQIVAVEVDFRSPREINEVQDTLSLVRLIRNKLDHPEYFTHLNAVINRFTHGGTDPTVRALNDLAEQIAKVYDLGRLERLSRFLGVEWENIAGDTLYQKAYGLARQMEQQGNMSQLLARLAEERDHVDWPESLDVGETEVDAGEDRRAPLAADGIDGASLAKRRINEAFFKCLAELSRVEPVAFFFDGCEKVPDVALKWIRYQLLDRVRKGDLEGVVVVLAGRTPPDLSELDIDRMVVDVKLKGFGQKHAGQFFAAHGLEVEEEEIEVLLRWTDGVPGLLARMIDRVRARSDKKDPFLG